MRKKAKILIMVAILVLTCVTAVAAQNNFPGEESAKQMGFALKDSAKTLINKGSNLSKNYGQDQDNTVAIIMGEEVSKEYFMYRMSLYEACHAENPAQDTWNLVKKQAFERNFADSHQLLPSEADIIAATNQQRELAESTKESHEIAKTLINSMGLSEDEYWNTFKPKYETEPLLISENVAAYCSENNVSEADLGDIEYEVTNTAFFDELNVKY